MFFLFVHCEDFIILFFFPEGDFDEPVLADRLERCKV